MKNTDDITKTERLHRLVSGFPAWILSVVCLLVILYLTLMPDPLGKEELPLFPGADKIVHGLMFFGLTLCMLFDLMRSRHWQPLGLPAIALPAFIGMAIGIGIEYVQEAMHMGRGKEFMDMVADAAGAIVAGALWLMLQNAIGLTEKERREAEALKGSSEIHNN